MVAKVVAVVVLLEEEVAVAVAVGGVKVVVTEVEAAAAAAAPAIAVVIVVVAIVIVEAKAAAALTVTVGVAASAEVAVVEAISSHSARTHQWTIRLPTPAKFLNVRCANGKNQTKSNQNQRAVELTLTRLQNVPPNPPLPDTITSRTSAKRSSTFRLIDRRCSYFRRSPKYFQRIKHCFD